MSNKNFNLKESSLPEQAVALVLALTLFTGGSWLTNLTSEVSKFSQNFAEESYASLDFLGNSYANFFLSLVSPLSPSSASLAVASTPDTLAPSAPSNLSVKVTSVSAGSLIWTPSTDTVGVTGYLITQVIDTINYTGKVISTQKKTATVTSPSYVLNPFSLSIFINVKYSLTVQAKDATGNLSNSVTVSFNIIPKANSLPVATILSTTVNKGTEKILATPITTTTTTTTNTPSANTTVTQTTVTPPPPSIQMTSSTSTIVTNDTTTSTRLTVISPNERRKITLGQKYQIQYQASQITSVSIALHINDQWMKWLTKDLSVTASGIQTYDWTPSAQERSLVAFGDVFKIYVLGEKADGTGSLEDRSDTPFGFIGASSVVPVNPNINLKVNGSDGPVVASKNEKITVSWGTRDALICTLSPVPALLSTSRILSVPVQGSMTFFPVLSDDGSGYLSLDCIRRTSGARLNDVVILNPNPATASSIILLTPNGERGIGMDEPYTIQWIQKKVKAVAISLLYKDVWVKNITSTDFSSADTTDGQAKSFTWIPSAKDEAALGAGKNFKVQILGRKTDDSGAVMDRSDTSFEFVQSANPSFRAQIGMSLLVPNQNISTNVPNQIFGAFVTDIRGEGISVGRMPFAVVLHTPWSGTTASPLTGISLYNENNEIIAGPVDAVGVGNRTGNIVTFNNTVIFPTGRHTYYIKGRVASGVSTSTILQVLTKPSFEWTNVRGQASGNAITLSGQDAGAFSMQAITVFP
ncbi:MAG: fibronectin type III domain-containing protein [Patescibacteria group bacterium]